jgi:ABC-type Zn uptake system ZnuABC Zn-binding protein ZnuA
MLGEIHRGAQGIVYRAEQERTRRPVAVKMLLQGAFATSRQRARFEREAEIAAQLRHPNIVTVYDSMPVKGGRFALVMEFIDGKPLDEWVSSLIDAAHKGASDVVRLGEGLDTSDAWVYLTSATPGTSHAVDPHIWLDPNGAALYVQRIADRVAHDRPELTDAIHATSTQGLASIHALDVEVGALFAAIPAESRKIVTFHDAFGYYARAYKITIVGVAIASPGQDPSAREIAALIDAIRAAGVTTVFSEIQFPSKVLTSIAAETGATVLVDLYSDALGAAPGDTYLGAMRANATAIAASMQR